MVDWHLVAKVVGGGYGTTFLVLIAISLVVWVITLIIVRYRRTKR